MQEDLRHVYALDPVRYPPKPRGNISRGRLDLGATPIESKWYLCECGLELCSYNKNKHLWCPVCKTYKAI